MKTPFNVARILRTGFFLATIPPQKFDLSSWADHADEIDAKDQKVLGIANMQFQDGQYSTHTKIAPTSDMLAHSCGTTACALGYAGSIPDNIAEGLQLFADVVRIKSPWQEEWCEIGETWVEYTTRNASGRKVTYKYFGAGAKFFGISLKESEQLFSLAYYDKDENWTPQPIDVVNKMVELLRKYGYNTEANQLAKAPRYRVVRWANQYGSGEKTGLYVPR